MFGRDLPVTNPASLLMVWYLGPDYSVNMGQHRQLLHDRSHSREISFGSVVLPLLMVEDASEPAEQQAKDPKCPAGKGDAAVKLTHA